MAIAPRAIEQPFHDCLDRDRRIDVGLEHQGGRELLSKLRPLWRGETAIRESSQLAQLKSRISVK